MGIWPLHDLDIELMKEKTLSSQQDIDLVRSGCVLSSLFILLFFLYITGNRFEEEGKIRRVNRWKKPQQQDIGATSALRL